MVLALASLTACSEPAASSTETAQTTTRDDDPEPASPTPAPPEPAPEVELPPPEDAVPSRLVVINRRAEPITLVESAEPFALERREGEPEGLRIGGFGPLALGPSCLCWCGHECLVCEPPRYRERVIEPGGTHEVTYSGRVRVWDDGCNEPYALPPGPRTFRVCLEGAHMPDATCASATVDYPAPRIELVFDD